MAGVSDLEYKESQAAGSSNQIMNCFLMYLSKMITLPHEAYWLQIHLFCQLQLGSHLDQQVFGMEASLH